MAERELEPGLLQFIARHIRSVEQMEVLSLLAGDKQKAWSPSDVFRIIQSSQTSVAECLALFRKQQLLEVDAGGLFRFKPHSSELETAATAAVKAYRERRVSVVKLIYQKSSERNPDFPDAFRIRKQE